MKIGVIGTGSIVEAFLSALSQVNHATCTAVFSRKETTARPLADKYEIPHIYTNLDEIVSSSQLDWVYIASPNSLHFEYARLALQHGKHVICEKPFTSNAHELQQLIQLAKEKHLFLFEAITNIHLPNYRWIKDNVHRLGSIRMIQCNYSQYSRKYDQLLAGETPNVFNPQFSGGALMDINLYNVHFILNLFGTPQQLSYTANKHENGIDTSGALVMQYDGFTASAVGCKDTRGMNFVLIQGEQGYIHVENGANGCRNVHLHIGDTNEQYNVQTTDNPLYYELVDFVDMFQNDDYEQCYQLLDYSYTVMQTLDRARQDAGIVFAADSAQATASSN
ncbi:Gfo/Idh/MocA family protein [Paenibacillus sp. WLX2291]|uniref:Gfo/Idh/MocA family protein n=1 Tax=Paenibacillus sp. WLX2291 TaxID=3296934 RepID=UPI0039844B60